VLKPSVLRRVGAAGLVIALLVGACAGAAAPATQTPGGQPVTLRLGYFPNVTHAAALVADRGGIFAEQLGEGVELRIHNFNAGGEAIEALFGDALDATYIGPNPAINGFMRSGGEALRVVSGATSGGAFFVVRQGIDSAADLRGARVAHPQPMGNTQDVALRAWLADQGLSADMQGGGDVSIRPLPNAQALEAFVSGEIDGAWVPEPWATRMLEQGGHILVDERDLWPEGRYVTTQLIVRTAFLEQHPDVVRDLIRANMLATDFVNERPEEAQALVSQGIEAITGTSVSPDTLRSAWPNLLFTVDPIASSLQKSAEDAAALGFLPDFDPAVSLHGIYDLALLNEVLREAGRPEVAQP
jgi:NitT/TauT family transport system substrate-binding protein